MKKAEKLTVMFCTVLSAMVCTSGAVTFEGRAWGEWRDPVHDADDVYSIANLDLGGGVATFDWGMAIPESVSSMFTHDGVGSDGLPLWTAQLDQDFVIGAFSYRNGSSYRVRADGILGVDLGLTLDILKIDLAPTAISETFDYSFTMINTPNSDPVDPIADADIVHVNSGVSLNSFNYNGQDYSLVLVGFSTDGGNTILTDFSSPEGDTAHADLYARITKKDVPDGGGTLALLALGLAGLRLIKRR